MIKITIQFAVKNYDYSEDKYLRLRVSVNFHSSCSNNDVVDGDVDEFDKESNESHESKSNSCSNSNLLELLSVWLGASLDQSH